MSDVTDDAGAAFEPHRRYLTSIAYRMLGSVAEAEDAIQDAFLRWQGTDRSTVEEPRAYLARIVTRLCLDRLKSARVQREQYVGTWLPEPIVEDATTPAENVAHDASVALLLTLERLSPLERAAFLLHDVFDMDYGAVAGVLERSEAAVRQLAARARDHVREERTRFEPSREVESRLVQAFAHATRSGDTNVLASILAEDAVLYTDGGGKRLAALNPIYGRDKIVRFFEGVARKGSPGGSVEDLRAARINGMPGFVVQVDDHYETVALQIVDDQITAMYFVRNPDKLRHVS